MCERSMWIWSKPYVSPWKNELVRFTRLLKTVYSEGVRNEVRGESRGLSFSQRLPFPHPLPPTPQFNHIVIRWQCGDADDDVVKPMTMLRNRWRNIMKPMMIMLWNRWTCCDTDNHVVKPMTMLWNRWLCCNAFPENPPSLGSCDRNVNGTAQLVYTYIYVVQFHVSYSTIVHILI